ncbi:hypothetical protein [Phreatobacter sp.]|uniref:hypothetical protein n=1 Tax=Phreatobacter sp. TaxID=1966341 RepID=UPI003F6F47FA
MTFRTRVRPRLPGLVGIALLMILPAALGASYILGFNATSPEERTLYWQLTIALALALPIGPLLILFGCELETRADIEIQSKLERMLYALETANDQAAALDAGFSSVRELAEHMKRRIESPPEPPTSRFR